VDRAHAAGRARRAGAVRARASVDSRSPERCPSARCQMKRDPRFTAKWERFACESAKRIRLPCRCRDRKPI
jgi:hypothetical protein